VVLFYGLLSEYEFREKNWALFPPSRAGLDAYDCLMVSVPTELMYTSSMPHLLRCQASGFLVDTTLNLQTISVSCVDHLSLKIDSICII